MAKKPAKGEFTFFDVVYEDGSQRSNRRVPNELVAGHEGEKAAKAFIEQQDREIAEKSGMPPLSIKSVRRSGIKYSENQERKERYANSRN